MFRQAGRVRAGVDEIAGNHVIIAVSPTGPFVGLVHLRDGSVRVGIGNDVAPLDAAACPAGELASRVGRALDDGRDLLEGHSENVVQDERDTFGRREGLEYHEQCKANTVG